MFLGLISLQTACGYCEREVSRYRV